MHSTRRKKINRTPSGNAINHSVSKTRTFFSPGRELSKTEKSVGNCSQGVNALHDKTGYGSRSRLNNHKDKQNTNRLTCLKDEDSDWETDSEFYTTPPVTPIRPVSKTHQSKSGQQKASSNTYKMDQENKGIAITEEESIVSRLEAVVNATDGPKTLDSNMVLEMFRKLEQNLEKKVNELSNKDEVDRLCQKIEGMEIQSKAIKGATIHLEERSKEMEERLRKIELNNHKKMVILTGLYTDEEEEKDNIRDQIEQFIQQELMIEVEIEDFFELGFNQPTPKVLILNSLREKQRLMNHKQLLKGLKNEDGKSYYLNDYYPPDQKELRKKNKEIFEANENSENKKSMELKGSVLKIDDLQYSDKIKSPSAKDILKRSTKEIENIMKIPICKGPEIEKKGNKFRAFTLAVKDHQEIEEAYLKMRVCNPEARHIICAYKLMGIENSFDAENFCDDGEHGAGEKILKLMQKNDVTQRVIFVTRHYSGIKLGPIRFDCMSNAVKKCMELYSYNEILKVNQELSTDSETVELEGNQREANTNMEIDMDGNQNSREVTDKEKGKRKYIGSSYGQYRGKGNYRQFNALRGRRNGPLRGKNNYQQKRPLSVHTSPEQRDYDTNFPQMENYRSHLQDNRYSMGYKLRRTDYGRY